VNALAVLLVVLTAGDRLYGKAEVASWLLLAVYFRILDGDTTPVARRIALLCGLQLAWANLHGGYPLGILAPAAYAVGERLERRGRARERQAEATETPVWPLWLPVVLLAVSLVGPGGLAGRFAPFGERWHPTDALGTELLLEWRSPFAVPEWRPRLLYLLALAVGLLSFRGVERRRWARLLLLLGLAAVAATALRHTTGLAVCAALLLVRHAAERQAPRRPGAARTARRWLEAGAAVALGTALVVAAVLLRAGRHGFEAGQSAGRFFTINPRTSCPRAAAFVRQSQLPSPLFNDFQMGGYLATALFPEHRIFIDGRALDPEMVKRYTEMVASAGRWRAAAARYGFRTAVLGLYSRTVRAGAGRALASDSRWRLAHLDPLAAVFVRQPGPPARPELRGPDGEPPFVGRLRGAPRRAALGLQRWLLREDSDNYLVEHLAALGQLGFAAEVHELATAALAALPDHALLLRQRCAARLVLARPAEALADCEGARARAPRDPSITALLAQALAAAGRASEAVSLLEGALREDPSQKELRSTLDLIRARARGPAS